MTGAKVHRIGFHGDRLPAKQNSHVFSVWGGRWNVRKSLKINNKPNPSHNIIKEI